MKKLFFFFVLFIVSIITVSCSEEPKKDTSETCKSNDDCSEGYECDPTTGKCVWKETGDDKDVLPTSDDDPVTNDKETVDKDQPDTDDDEPNDDPVEQECTPGDEETCPYQGPAGTEDVGECKAGVRTCKENGTWGFCEGEVLPVEEIGDLCSDGLDNDCSGNVDTGIDYDGDGVPYCLDCCEFEKDCPDPESAWDSDIHFCSWEEEDNDHLYDCCDDLPEGTKDPYNYAKAMGLCKKVAEDSGEWGVISAEILLPDGQAGAHLDSHNVLSGLGDNIEPQLGIKMLALSSGEAIDPFPNEHRQWLTTSEAPSDWLLANGGKIPNSPGCPEPADGVNDPVMFKMDIRVPMGVKSFSFNIYFLSTEFPFWVCQEYNDFFITLLDSEHTSEDPQYQNPEDKNLAMAPGGYPVGVNMAMMEDSELFTVCEISDDWPSCHGAEDLTNTGGFETFPHIGEPAKRGGTGWLTVRGNVVGGEIITLRMAIWDTMDHIFDSMVLIDNFKWQFEEYIPGVEK